MTEEVKNSPIGDFDREAYAIDEARSGMLRKTPTIDRFSPEAMFKLMG